MFRPGTPDIRDRVAPCRAAHCRGCCCRRRAGGKRWLREVLLREVLRRCSSFRLCSLYSRGGRGPNGPRPPASPATAQLQAGSGLRLKSTVVVFPALIATGVVWGRQPFEVTIS